MTDYIPWYIGKQGTFMPANQRRTNDRLYSSVQYIGEQGNFPPANQRRTNVGLYSLVYWQAGNFYASQSEED